MMSEVQGVIDKFSLIIWAGLKVNKGKDEEEEEMGYLMSSILLSVTQPCPLNHVLFVYS